MVYSTDKYSFLYTVSKCLCGIVWNALEMHSKDCRFESMCSQKFLLRDASAECGYEIACRPSVCLSVTIRYRVQIRWNSSKIISWPN